MEWNDLRNPVGENSGSYDNPHDLNPDMWTLMRFTEWENDRDRQSRVADPQGRLHALRGSGLPEGLPVARRDRAICQRHRRFHQRELHRLRLLRQGLPVQHSAHLQRITNPTNARCAPTASPVGLEPACVKACPTGAIMFGTKTDMKDAGPPSASPI
jgi:formate dehydrogenase iron-sulfur subunit